MTESWFPVPHYDNRYEVSNLGNLRHTATGKPVHERIRAEQRQARLSRGPGDCCWVPVKDLVAQVLMRSDTDGDTCVIHRDGDPSNCAKDNLYIDHGVGTPIPTKSPRTHCRRGHALTGRNLDPRGRCWSCKVAYERCRHRTDRDVEAEAHRLYESIVGVDVTAPVPEFFDRRGIGVWDVYVSF